MEHQATAALLLYVEDEVLLQEVLIAALSEAGYEVMAVKSGAEGINALLDRTAELRGLITDINLGTGPDGWDVARQARELISGLPVLYVSGASHQDWTSKGVPQSVMISKPFAPAQIVVAISALLNSVGPKTEPNCDDAEWTAAAVGLPQGAQTSVESMGIYKSPNHPPK